MKANELRIGNWVVNSITGRIVKVYEVLTSRILITTDHPNEVAKRTTSPLSSYSGIPLSPEILEKCGFERYKESSPPINEEIEFWANGLIEVFFDMSNALIIKDYHVSISRPKYLHQLQNLYFALNGEELEYKGDKL